MSVISARFSSKHRSVLPDTSLEVQVRAAEPADSSAIQSLVTHLTEELFGPFNILNIIEKSLFSVTLIDSSDEVIGFAAFSDCPPPSARMTSSNWPTQMAQELSLENFTSLNTMFLHLFVAKTDFAVGCIQEIVKAVFASVPDCAQIVLSVPNSSHPDPAISDIFRPVKKTTKASSTANCTFFVSHRHDISPVLHVRPAQMEDNDDLTPLFAQQNNQLQQTYGDYFVAELIDSQDEKHHALCAEKGGRAVGFISLSSDVNVDLLNQAFELGPFHGLRKPHKDDVLEPSKTGATPPAQKKISHGGEGVATDELPMDLEATVCMVGSDIEAINGFLKAMQASNESSVKESQNDDGSMKMSVTLEHFNRTVKLHFVSMLDQNVLHGGAKEKDALTSSDCVILLYKPTQMETIESTVQIWNAFLNKGTSNNMDPSVSSEADFDPTNNTASTVDHVDSHMVPPPYNANGGRGEQMKLFVADVSDTETADGISTPGTIEDLAAEFSVGVMEMSLLSCAQDATLLRDTLSHLTEAICRTHYGLSTPSLPDDDEGHHSGDKSHSTNKSKTSTRPPVSLSTIAAPVPFVPEYKGESNCFCIQLFCMREELETRSGDFLASAFQCYPDRDYCVLTVPHLVPEFMLLQQFVRVTPRVQSNLGQELYIFNRYGLLSDFEVRPCLSADLAQIERLTAGLEHRDRMLADVRQYNEARRDKDGTPLHAFSACVGGPGLPNSPKQVVGICVVRQEEQIEYLKSCFNIEDFVYYSHHQRSEHGHLHHMVMNPIFHHLTRTFLKEVMRLDGKSCLYYPVFSRQYNEETGEREYSEEEARHTLVTCLGEMVPVRPRRQISYPLHMLHGNVPSERVLRETHPFALYSLNRKLVLEPKIAINARIVVVGASDTSLAFLESLVFSAHLRFNNVTLVSPHGLPGELPVSKEAQEMLSTSLSFTRERLSRMCLRSWVTVVTGNMVHIDRKSKRIHIQSTLHNKGALEGLSYDHLVLATGNQYQIPFPLGMYGNKDEDEIRKDFSAPPNVFTINDDFEADHLLYYVRTHLTAPSTDHVVVLGGGTVDMYGCVRMLLNNGVKGDKIILARRELEEGEPTCFNNPQVEELIDSMLTKNGVRVLDKCELYSWRQSDSTPDHPVCEVSLKVDGEWESYSCQCVISFQDKRVDFHAFKAVNDSCLVFDSRLVIDSDFHTNDVCVRAAGPLTKFSRRYHADQWSHANFNSHQVGSELAHSMLRLFDPTIEQPNDTEDDFDLEGEDDNMRQQLNNMIPIYSKPTVVYCVLPGEFEYLCVRKPDLLKRAEEARKEPNYGKEYVTGSLDTSEEPTKGDKSGYFMIHVNNYSTVQTVTCVNKRGEGQNGNKRSSLRSGNIMCLYGKNEKLLNRMVSRFEEGLIKDFYTYFEEPWAMALFHDRFEDLLLEIREILTNPPPVQSGDEGEDGEMNSFTQKVRAIIEENMEMKSGEWNKLMKEFQSGGYKKSVETRLLAYLSYNYYHLPMYAKPGML
ncbi:cilia- and flagella-associated protein 61-like isoform X1 [Symsagittifera roscoffensis]|uniref:cilia- and flagella-associated protein 61-like isoform X1 n=1 Tax=Symsagittifera roscoffensis TaxID=84072 RepID=UPI00307C3A2A